MRRREFLGKLALWGGWAVMGDWEVLSSLVDVAHVDASVVDDARRVTGYWRERNGRMPPGLVVEGLQDHLSHLFLMLGGSVEPGQREPLLATAGESALLAARNAFRAGLSPGDVEARFDLARELARESGDQMLEAAALAWTSDSLYASTYGLPGNENWALRLLNQAVYTAGPHAPAQLVAAIRANRAERHAVRGQATDCWVDLEAAREALMMSWARKALMMKGDESSPALLRPANLVELDAVAGGCEVMLARATRNRSQAYDAERVLQDAYERMEPESVSWRAILQGDLAAAYALQGNPEGSVVALGQALQLSLQASSHHTLTRIARIRRTHLGSIKLPGLEEFDQQLQEARA